MSKHIFILLDVDDTLVIFDRCTEEKIVLTGGKHHWPKLLKRLRTELKKIGIIVHFGIATAKSEFIDATYKGLNKRGDLITGHLLEEKSWLDNVLPEQHINYGLKELIDPELIFFVGEHIEALRKKYNAKEIDTEEYSEEFYKAKVEQALRSAKGILEKRYNIVLNNADGYLIDNEAAICKAVNAAGFNGLCVDGLIHKNKKDQKEFLTDLFLGKGFLPVNNNNNNNNNNLDLFASIAEQALQDLADGNNVANNNNNNTIDDIPPITLNQNSFFHAGSSSSNSSTNKLLFKRLGMSAVEPNKRIKLEHSSSLDSESKMDSGKGVKP